MSEPQQQADRDEVLLREPKRIAAEKPSLAPQATKLMADAAKGKFKAGWSEDAEGLITKAFPRNPWSDR